MLVDAAALDAEDEDAAPGLLGIGGAGARECVTSKADSCAWSDAATAAAARLRVRQ